MRLIDLPLGSLVRLGVDAEGFLTSRKVSVRFISATIVSHDYDAVLLGWKEMPQTRSCWFHENYNYGGALRNYVANFNQFRYFFWIDGLQDGELMELHPDQKCFTCQIPMPHLAKTDVVMCKSCQMLTTLN